MLALLIIVLVLLVVWVVYGRGAYIVYKHKKDEGVLLPENADKEQVMEALKNNLGYKDAKEIFFDENGEICIAGKNDTYVVQIRDGRAYIDDYLFADISDDGNKTITFLAKLGNLRIRTRRKKNRARVEEIECIRAYVAKLFDRNAPVNAYKKYTNMTRARKYSGIVSVMCVVLAVILFVCAVVGGNEEQEIDSVKMAYLEDFSTEARIGEALDDYFVKPTWKTYSENGKEYVKFSGEFLYYGKTALAEITFEFLELDWFKVGDISINGSELSEYEMDEFLIEIFNSYEE